MANGNSYNNGGSLAKPGALKQTEARLWRWMSAIPAGLMVLAVAFTFYRT